jgi:hypothetical protein
MIDDKFLDELIPKPISFPIYYTIFMLEIRASIQNSRFWDRLIVNFDFCLNIENFYKAFLSRFFIITFRSSKSLQLTQSSANLI